MWRSCGGVATKRQTKFRYFIGEERWAVSKLGVEEWLVSAVMRIQVHKQLSEQFMVIVVVFKVKVGMHQGSALSPLLLWPSCMADADIIFLPCDFYLLSFFPHLISTVADWMFAIL